MKLGLTLPYEGSLSFPEALELAQRAEALGFDSVWAPEAYGTDAISILGALAARTERIQLGTGIVNVFSRTPALLAQTAATLDLISGGRFILGLGTSGHQVVAGWHGMAFEQPLLRMRETMAIVRQVLRRDRLVFDGDVFHLDMGLKLLAHPVREMVPIYLATLTPGGLRLTGELADGWIPTLFAPEHIDLFRPELEFGARLAGRSLDSLAIAPHVPVSIDDDRARAREPLKPWVALYVGGMGSRAKNFYNDLVRALPRRQKARGDPPGARCPRRRHQHCRAALLRSRTARGVGIGRRDDDPRQCAWQDAARAAAHPGDAGGSRARGRLASIQAGNNSRVR